MLKTYEALYENGQIKWLSDRPEIRSARVLVTVIEELTQGNCAEKNQARQAAQALAKLGGTEPHL